MVAPAWGPPPTGLVGSPVPSTIPQVPVGPPRCGAYPQGREAALEDDGGVGRKLAQVLHWGQPAVLLGPADRALPVRAGAGRGADRLVVTDGAAGRAQGGQVGGAGEQDPGGVPVTAERCGTA